MELKIGVIGTGAIGRDHINRVMTKLQGAKVVAVSDINADGARKVAEQYGAKFYASGEGLIASRDVEAVIVTSWDPTHEKYVLEAIKNKKHVFVEKPLAVRAEDCRRIIDAEIAGGKQLVQVGYMRRFDSGYIQLKEAIQSRKYGEPLMLHCAHRNAGADESYTTAMEVENSAVHEFDVLRWLLDEDYDSARVVFAKKTRHSHENLRDPQIIQLATKSGVLIDIEVFVNCQYGYDIKCDVVCEDAIISLPEPSNPQIRSNAARSVEIFTDWKKRFVSAYDLELQLWINATKEGRVDGPSAWDGYTATYAATICSQARDSGETVKFQTEEMPEFYNEANSTR
jgi:myo-inositol 2-dehydrogenase/D-chiro-inositol 1-dehydrogenase